mmetsp:Transcript_6777/g.17714  ORF Transcript_6777/g.17714 Transcript_6777/m.17714 type:complete len:280 (+) Transcript_6777:108-947(+)
MGGVASSAVVMAAMVVEPSVAWSSAASVPRQKNRLEVSPCVAVAPSSMRSALTCALDARRRSMGRPECDERAMVATLRRLFGERESAWGDLDARRARVLYRQLLPQNLVDHAETVRGDARLHESLARTASAARAAAKHYVRERSAWPARVVAGFIDAARHGGCTSGATVDELLDKYSQEACHRLGAADPDEDAVRRLACDILLEKSVETNQFIDRVLLDDAHVEARDRAWDAALLAFADDDQPKLRLAPVVRVKWIKRNLIRRVRSSRPAMLAVNGFAD